jgi:hypothetical protein
MATYSSDTGEMLHRFHGFEGFRKKIHRKDAREEEK